MANVNPVLAGDSSGSLNVNTFDVVNTAVSTYSAIRDFTGPGALPIPVSGGITVGLDLIDGMSSKTPISQTAMTGELDILVTLGVVSIPGLGLLGATILTTVGAHAASYGAQLIYKGLNPSGTVPSGVADINVLGGDPSSNNPDTATIYQYGILPQSPDPDGFQNTPHFYPLEIQANPEIASTTTDQSTITDIAHNNGVGKFVVTTDHLNGDSSTYYITVGSDPTSGTSIGNGLYMSGGPDQQSTAVSPDIVQSSSANFSLSVYDNNPHPAANDPDIFGTLEQFSDNIGESAIPFEVGTLPFDRDVGDFQDAEGEFHRAQIDPLVIDLSGEGINLSPLSASNAFFDFSEDGLPSLTAWTKPGTGFLVIPGQDGTVRSGSDLVNDFSQLRALDQNNDGVIDEQDPEFSRLRVWQDFNGDGVSQPGEMFTLSSLGIFSISLEATNTCQEVSDSTILSTALVTMQDGSTREIAQVSLATDTMHTLNSAPINIASPDGGPRLILVGYGTLQNLPDAALSNPALVSDVSDILGLNPAQTNTFDSAVQAMMMDWAQVTQSITGSGSTFDGLKLAFMEDLFGNKQGFGKGSPFPTLSDQSTALESAWNDLFSGMKARILAQNTNGNLFGSFAFVAGKDIVLPKNTFESSIATVGSLLTQGSNFIGEMIEAVGVINVAIKDTDAYLPQNSSEILSSLRNAFPSGILTDSILRSISTGSLSIFEDYGPGAKLYSGVGGNLFIINQAEQTIDGRGQSDEIIVQQGTSNLTIAESGTTRLGALIQLDQGFSRSDVSFSGDEQGGLVLMFGSDEVLKISNALTSPQNAGIQGVRFADGETLSLQTMINLEMSAESNASGVLYGTTVSDVLDGQGVDHVLVGNGGGDTFIFNIGYDTLEVSESDTTNMPSDVLQIGSGVFNNEVVVTSDAKGDLILNVADGHSDQIKIDQMLAFAASGVGSVRFSDGTVLTRQQLISLADTGSSGNTQITALLPNSQIDPAGYAHLVTSSGGDSTIIYSPGYGALEIAERDPSVTDANTLQFGSGISPGDIQISSDALGNIILTTGNPGDTVTLDAMALGPHNGIQRIAFSDGTVWTAQQILSQVSSSVSDYYGSVNFDEGEGNVTVSSMGISGVQLGLGIPDGDVYVQTDASDDLVVRLRDDPSETLTLSNDVYETSVSLTQLVSRVHQLFYSDGSFIDLTQALKFTWVGDANTHNLVGSNFAANTFEFGAGGDTVIAGNASESGPGTNTFVFNKGDGLGTVDMNGGSGVINLGAGINQSDVSLRSDQTGNLIVVINDTGDTLTIKGGLVQTAFGVSSPIDHIEFADRTSVPVALANFTPQSLTYSWVGVGDGTAMVGSPWGANSFIVGPGNASIVAGNGSMTGGQAGSAQNTFYFDQGDGHAMVNMNGGYGQVVLAADIAPYEVMLQSNAAGDLTLALRGDPKDSITFQGDLAGQAYQNASSRIGQVSFSDGSSISLGVTGLGQYSPMTFNWSGTTASTSLVGSNFGANVFDLGPGGDTVTAGDGSQGGSNANTFLFGRGDGNAVVTLNGGAGTLQLDASIMRSDVRFAANAQGDITVSIKGDTTDSITFLGDIYYTPFGPGSRLGAIQYGDGTNQQLGIHSYQSFMPTFTETGTATNTVLVGSNFGDNSFEFGPAAADGSGDTVTAGNPSQGGSGYNTFKLTLGSGHVHVTLGGGYGVLQLGQGLSASSLLLEANPQGDVTFAFANDSADSVTFTGDLYNRPFGPVSAINQVIAADGSSTPIGVVGYTDHPMTFTSIGTATNTVLTGSGYGANVFNFGLSDADGFGDTVTAGNGSQGGSGFNTFNYGAGDGNAMVNMNGGWGVLNFGGNIVLADLVFQADGQGNMTVSIAGNSQDTIKFNGDLSTGPYGTVSAVNKVSFSDGSSQMLDSDFWQAHPTGFA